MGSLTFDFSLRPARKDLNMPQLQSVIVLVKEWLHLRKLVMTLLQKLTPHALIIQKPVHNCSHTYFLPALKVIHSRQKIQTAVDKFSKVHQRMAMFDITCNWDGFYSESCLRFALENQAQKCPLELIHIFEGGRLSKIAWYSFGAVHKLCRLKIGDFWPPPS